MLIDGHREDQDRDAARYGYGRRMDDVKAAALPGENELRNIAGSMSSHIERDAFAFRIGEPVDVDQLRLRCEQLCAAIAEVQLMRAGREMRRAA